MIRLPIILLLVVGLSGCIVDKLVTPVAPSAPPPPPPPQGRSFYAAPNAAPGGSGGLTDPWDLSHALTGAGGVVAPGDTIWLRGGTYRAGEGGLGLRSTVSGRAGSPVVVRQYRGERAIIDGAGTPSGSSVLNVEGSWSVFWGFEVTNSDTTRQTTSTENAFRPNAVSNYAAHTRFINLVIHDGGVAFYADPSQNDVEIAGCIIYNNGWQAPDRGHGHGLYVGSDNGPLLARDNVVFNQFGYGVHAYTDSGSRLMNIHIVGNVAFNNGTLANNSSAANILLGGYGPAGGGVVEHNATYFHPGDTASANVRLGWNAVRNGSVQLRNNYFVGGGPVLEMGAWTSPTVTANSFIGTDATRLLISLTDPAPFGHRWGENVFNHDAGARAWSLGDSTYTFADWLVATGLTGAGRVEPGLPAPSLVSVRPNPYEPGRAHVVVYNWSALGSVAVDLRGVLSAGTAFQIHNVQDLFGAPVLAGTYDGGPVLVPIDSIGPPPPIGVASLAPSTGTRFNVYVVTTKS